MCKQRDKGRVRVVGADGIALWIGAKCRRKKKKRKKKK